MHRLDVVHFFVPCLPIQHTRAGKVGANPKTTNTQTKKQPKIKVGCTPATYFIPRTRHEISFSHHKVSTKQPKNNHFYYIFFEIYKKSPQNFINLQYGKR